MDGELALFDHDVDFVARQGLLKVIPVDNPRLKKRVQFKEDENVSLRIVKGFECGNLFQ